MIQKIEGTKDQIDARVLGADTVKLSLSGTVFSAITRIPQKGDTGVAGKSIKGDTGVSVGSSSDETLVWLGL